jgi:hypothetical protein
MCSTMAVAIWASFCGVLKTHFFLSSIGSTMRAAAAIADHRRFTFSRHVNHRQ